jgi:hypothetical protein
MLSREFWKPEPIEPIRLLAELRANVLERSHSRLPRWHFRVADDLVLRMQPKPGERRDHGWAFAGTAFFGEGITRALCDKPDGTLGMLTFGMLSDMPNWRVLPRFVRYPRGTLQRAGLADSYRERTLAALRSDCFATLRPEMMLSPACIFCGKALTDPASIARWIGPECAGTSRLGQSVLDLRGEAAR